MSSPTAMGRIPPSAFGEGSEPAGAQRGRAGGGVGGVGGGERGQEGDHRGRAHVQAEEGNGPTGDAWVRGFDLRESNAAWMSSVEGALPWLRPTALSNGECEPAGWRVRILSIVSPSASATLESPTNVRAAVPSLPFSTNFTTFPLFSPPPSL